MLAVDTFKLDRSAESTTAAAAAENVAVSAFELFRNEYARKASTRPALGGDYNTQLHTDCLSGPSSNKRIKVGKGEKERERTEGLSKSCSQKEEIDTRQICDIFCPVFSFITGRCCRHFRAKERKENLHVNCISPQRTALSGGTQTGIATTKLHIEKCCRQTTAPKSSSSSSSVAGRVHFGKAETL